MQTACVELARHVLGREAAHSTEFEPATPDPVICLLEEQKTVRDKGGTMRLGAYDCRLEPGSRARRAYGEDLVRERHRHRYEFNNAYRDELRERGLLFSGINPDRDLVEIVELRNHPWFVGVQFHPEFRSKPTRPHPLFRDFVGAALEGKG